MSKKPLLNQIVAIVTGQKAGYQKQITKIYHQLKQDQTDGLIRSYQPYDDADKTIPTNDSKAVQVDLRDVIAEFKELFTETENLTATQDVANCIAKADVVVDEQIVLKDVPVTHLLYLEKALTDMRTFIDNLPTLLPIHKWEYNSAQDCYATQPIKSTRTTKRKVKFVKAEATDKHPAQVDVFDEDVGVGTWSTTYISSALPVEDKKGMVRKIEALRNAVKKAREVANGIEVENQDYGKHICNFVFG